MLVLNVGAQDVETDGFSPANHVEVLAAHAPELELDYVLADLGMVDETDSLATAAKSLGAELIIADVALSPVAVQHDALRLASAFRQIMMQA